MQLFKVWLGLVMLGLFLAPYQALKEYHFDPNTDYLIVLVDRLGLANRLRIMAAAFTIASSSAKKLIILWKPSIECNAEFSSLFEPLGSLVEVIQFHEELGSPETLSSYFTDLSRLVPHQILIKFPNQFFINVSTSMGFHQIVVLRSLTSHAISGMSCEEYMRRKTQFYHLLHPIAEIQEKISHFSRRLQEKSSQYLVGVHYRVYDIRYDWPILPPTAPDMPDTVLTSQTFEESNPISLVIETLISIRRENPNIIFFFASNDRQAVQRLRKDCESFSVPFIESELKDLGDQYTSRSSLESMQDAVLDFFLLGSSDVILHSRGSSFAQEAAYLSKRNLRNADYFPISVIDLTSRITSTGRKVSLKILTNTPELEYCGLSEYYHPMMVLNDGWRSRSNILEKKSCFYEMTGEEYDTGELHRRGRTVCSYSQTLTPCSGFEEWLGMKDLFCAKPSSHDDERIVVYAEGNGLDGV